MPETTETRRAPHAAAASIEAQGLPPMTRAAAVEPSTLDEENRTVEVVWTTGQRVRRRRLFNEDFDEELDVSPEAVRLERLNNGAPVLDSHDSFELRNVIGVVEPSSVRIEQGQGVATLRFSERAEVEPLFQDIRAGIIRNVSVGYRVHRVVIEERDGDVDLVRAVDWEPMELSMVAVGADSDARVRAQAWAACDVERAAEPGTAHRHQSPNTGKDSAMTQENDRSEEAAAQDGSAGTPAANPETTRTDTGTQPAADAERNAVQAERRRVREIRELCRSVGVEGTVEERLIDDGTAIDAAREQVLTEIARHRDATAIRGVRVSGGQSSEDPTVMRAAMADALSARATFRPPEGQAQEFKDHTVRDLAMDLMRANGVTINTRNAHEIITRAFQTTSDFPSLLADVANKVLLSSYENLSPNYQLLAQRRNFRDFKPHHFDRAGDFPALLEKNESGEFKFGSMGEQGETVSLTTYGRILPLTRQALINDDLGAFTNMAQRAGQRAAALENASVMGLLQANPSLSDGNALFHSSHGNLAGSGALIGVDTIGAGRAAMRKQTSVDGEKINMSPSFLVTSPDHETKAEQFVSTNLRPDTAGNVNPFSGRLQVISDANLTGNPWYLMASPAMPGGEVLVYGYLQGAEGPQVAVENGFNVDGVAYRVHLDFAAGVVDYRGAYKNPGAAS